MPWLNRPNRITLVRIAPVTPLVICLLCLNSGCRHRAPVVAIGNDLPVVAGFGLIRRTSGEFFNRPRVWGKACTLVQSLMIVLCLPAPDMLGVTRLLWPVLYVGAGALTMVAGAD